MGSFGILKVKNDPAESRRWPQQEVETIDTEKNDKCPREKHMASGLGERCPPILGNDGFAIGDTPGV